MRVAHCVAGRPDPGALNGVNRTVHHLSRAQAGLGIGVSVFALDDRPPLESDGVDVRTFPRATLPFLVPAALVHELERRPPDVLHLHSPYFPAHVTLTRWARRHGVPYVITPHGALAPGAMRHRWPLKLPYKYLFERAILNGAAFVHAVGSHEALDRYGVNTPVVLVPNGVELPSTPPSTTAGLRARFPELAARRIFLYLGRLDPLQKGLDLLVAAARRASLAGAALVIAGPDWRGSRGRLDRLVAARPSATPVVLSGPLTGDDKFAALAEADVFVHCSRWEGLPHAVLEAAALARPCLLTAPADPLGRLGATGAAVVVDASTDAVTDGLRRMGAMSGEHLAGMGRAARALVLTEFTWRRSASELLDAYRRFTTAPADLRAPEPA